MTSTTIKLFFKNTYGLNLVRVKSNKRFVQAWIPSESSIKLVFKEIFPIEIRVKALGIIYPNHPISTTGDAGNVSCHGLAMSREEWSKLISQ